MVARLCRKALPPNADEFDMLVVAVRDHRAPPAKSARAPLSRRTAAINPGDFGPANGYRHLSWFTAAHWRALGAAVCKVGKEVVTLHPIAH